MTGLFIDFICLVVTYKFA